MDNIDWTKLSEVALIAIAVVILARTILTLTKNTGESDKREDGLLKQLIDLATSYKTESAEARDAYRQEAAATRAVIAESNDAQRETNVALRNFTSATNEQTGEIRLLRSDFKNYQVLNADEIETFRTGLDKFKEEVVEHLLWLRKTAERNADFVETAKVERELINRKLDELLIICKPPKVETAP